VAARTISAMQQPRSWGEVTADLVVDVSTLPLLLRFLSGRAAIPLIVICQCAVARRVVAP
jgi:hypothetical protein